MDAEWTVKREKTIICRRREIEKKTLGRFMEFGASFTASTLFSYFTLVQIPPVISQIFYL